MGIIEESRLDGKKIFVTNAARGIGKSIVTALAEAGADVAIIDLDIEEAVKTASEIAKDTGVKALAIKTDMSNPDEVDAMIAEIVNKFGRLDAVFCNVRICIDISELEMTYKQWKNMIDINLSGVFITAQAAGKQMLKQDDGTNINSNSASMFTHIINIPQSQCYDCSNIVNELFGETESHICLAQGLGEIHIIFCFDKVEQQRYQTNLCENIVNRMKNFIFNSSQMAHSVGEVEGMKNMHFFDALDTYENQVTLDGSTRNMLDTDLEEAIKGMLISDRLQRYLVEEFTSTTKRVNDILPKEPLNINFIVEKAKAYINENYERKLILEDICKEVYLTPNYFSSLFKKVTGETYMEYLQAVRMNQAKRLLDNPKLKIYEIATRIGYSNYKYFTFQFKKLIGVTPKEYRENLIKKME